MREFINDGPISEASWSPNENQSHHSMKRMVKRRIIRVPSSSSSSQNDVKMAFKRRRISSSSPESIIEETAMRNDGEIPFKRRRISSSSSHTAKEEMLIDAPFTVNENQLVRTVVCEKFPTIIFMRDKKNNC